MAAQKPPVPVSLTWQGDLRFDAVMGEARMTLDSAGRAGPSPMQALAAGLAGCMAMDVTYILGKARVPPTALTAHLVGHRSDATPSRFERVELKFTVRGDVPSEQMERAITLSREKYCSVLFSLREDIVLETSFEVVDREG